MIEKTAWDVRKYPEKFAVYRILCNFAVVFQNCINSMEAKAEFNLQMQQNSD